jgi:type VI secretion system secreted protein VgrG
VTDGGGNIVLEVDNGTELVVRQLTAHETLGRPFQIDIIALSLLPPSGGGGDVGPLVDIDGIIGKRAAVRVSQGGSTHRIWTGVVSYVEQVRWAKERGSESSYHVRLVPTFWLLSQRKGNRIFQHVKIPDVLKTILEQEWKLEVEWSFDDKAYPKKEYVCQYDESDMHFVHRLLEEAGLYYFFGETGSGDAKTVLVVTDKAHTFAPSVDLPFTDAPNEVHAVIYATNVAIAHNVRPGLFQISDFNFRRPGHPLFAASEPASGTEASREIYLYEPGGFLKETGGPAKGPSDEKIADDKSTTVHDAAELGKARAQRFLEAARHKKRYVHFETSAQTLTPGKVFTISEHPNAELEGQRLLAIQSMVRVTATGEWTVVVEGVFTDLPYRTPRTTKKPRVRGVQSAIVVGPKGEEIYSDEFGRVRIKMHWDREGDFDDNSTCWMRVSQAWAGAQYGTMMIPRIGHEVIVDFLDGDPDQPLVVGRVYTHPSPAPYKLPDHATRSSWQSNTTPNKDGEKWFNEIMFEDKKGEELVLIQAQRNMMSLTKRNHTERTGEHRSHVVGRDWVHVVGAVDVKQVGEQHLVQMVDIGNLNILEKKAPAYSKKPTLIAAKDGKLALTTGKASIVLDGGDIIVQADKGIRMSADKNLIIAGGPMVFINAMSGRKVNPEAFWKIKDEIPEPEGAVLNSIIRLFHDKWKAKQRQGDGERKIRALVESEVATVPALAQGTLDAIAKGDMTEPPAKLLDGVPFIDGADAADVAQGSIGDCYLAAAMASVAHAQPELVQDMVRETMEGKVQFAFEGGDAPVTVDKAVPMQGSKPLYTKSTKAGQTWPQLMQKAYAEEYGKLKPGKSGYTGMGSGGFAGEAMERIAGGTSHYSQPSSMSDAALLDRLSKASEKPTVASSLSPPKETTATNVWTDNGIRKGHAYSVLGTKKGPAGEDLVMVRNPWASKTHSTGKGDVFEMPLSQFKSDFRGTYQLTP